MRDSFRHKFDQLRYCQFHVLYYFSTSRWQPSWNAKLQKIKLLHAWIIVIQNWYDSIKIFFVSHFAILAMEAILTGLSLILKQLNARTILT